LATLAQLGKKLEKLNEELVSVSEDLSGALTRAQDIADQASALHQELVDSEDEDD